MALTGITINSPSTEDLQQKKQELDEGIKKLQKMGVSSPISVETVWGMIEPRLLTKRQIAKKILMMQKIDEESAQVVVYGKLYYKNGKLYDNDKLEPNCVAKPTDEDYFASPMWNDEDEENSSTEHPLLKKIKNIIEEIKNSLDQLITKLGEFLSASIEAVVTIAVSLVSLVASATILPFGSGLPNAITAVRTMMKSIKDIQSKTAEILPHLNIADYIGLILPKQGQIVISTLNVVFTAFMTVLGLINALVGSLTAITSKLGSATKKMESNTLKIDPKSEQTSDGNTLLTANATGGDYQYTYEWAVEVVGNDNNITYQILQPDENLEEDDGKRTVKVLANTTYKCKVKDGTGTTKEKLLLVKV